VRLSTLLGLRVHTESGGQVGRVYDVRAHVSPSSIVITGFVVGRIGFLERLGIGAGTARGRIRSRDFVAWHDVIRADRRGVVIRDGAEPR